MARKVNITDKLKFQENPVLVIGDMELEVNADATTMLKIMEVFKDDGMDEREASIQAYELLFSEKERKKIEEKKISFQDFMTIISEAMNVVANSVEGE